MPDKKVDYIHDWNGYICSYTYQHIEYIICWKACAAQVLGMRNDVHFRLPLATLHETSSGIILNKTSLIISVRLAGEAD